MIHKSTPLAGQLRAMKIGETFKVNARAGISTEVIKSTAKRLRKEGYDYTIITAGHAKGSCSVTRIEPRERVERPKERKENRKDHHIVVLSATPSRQAHSTTEIATTFKVDYLEAGERKKSYLPVIYDRYEYWNKRMKYAGVEAANKYIAKLIEDTLQ